MVHDTTPDVATRLNRRIGVLRKSGLGDIEVVGGMSDHMAAFKLLIDTGHDRFEVIAQQHEPVHWFGVQLTNLAEAIEAGHIDVPPGWNGTFPGYSMCRYSLDPRYIDIVITSYCIVCE